MPAACCRLLCLLPLLLTGAGAFAAERAALPDGFVHLAEIDPSIGQDIRYAGASNFLGRRVKGYEGASCILTKPAAQALAVAQTRAREEGLSLVAFDCYRPAQAVADFVAWTREGGPADPRWHPATPRGELIRQGYIGARSAHSRGSTVDVGLMPVETDALSPDPACGAAHDPDAATVDFGTGFDCFDPSSRTASRQVGRDAQANRRLLVELMDQAGFRNYAAEWWHFTLRGEPHPKRVFDFPVSAP